MITGFRHTTNTKRGGYMDKKVVKTELTWSEKIDLYHKQQYKVEIPPVSTMFWETADWIRFIDKHGEWLC